jgi:hypothetical protein
LRLRSNVRLGRARQLRLDHGVVRAHRTTRTFKIRPRRCSAVALTSASARECCHMPNASPPASRSAPAMNTRLEPRLVPVRTPGEARYRGRPGRRVYGRAPRRPPASALERSSKAFLVSMRQDNREDNFPNKEIEPRIKPQVGVNIPRQSRGLY